MKGIFTVFKHGHCLCILLVTASFQKATQTLGAVDLAVLLTGGGPSSSSLNCIIKSSSLSAFFALSAAFFFVLNISRVVCFLDLAAERLVDSVPLPDDDDDELGTF